MSRCFPFPPPGYEKKARPDDENLLAKGKHKEKKRKKEKKDKDRKESKDKKDKDRREEKHREKKDRKEKHKDKKEKRGKDKDKGEKKKTSDQKNITFLPQPNPENRNSEENLISVSTTTIDKHKDKEEKTRISDNKNITVLPLPGNLNGGGNHTTTTDDTKEFKFLFELGKRNRDNDKAVQKINLSGQRRAELPNGVVESHMASVAEMGKRNRDNDRDTLVQKINLPGQKSAELPNSVGESNIAGLAKGNDFAKANRDEDNGKNQKQNSTKDMEIDHVKRNSEKPTAEKESKRKHGSDSKKEKHGDKDREKKSKSKDKKKEKEEKTKDKKHDKDQRQQTNLKETSKDNSEEFRNIRPLSEQPSGIILGKRKEPEINGFLHENDTRPKKLSRQALSSHQILENGSVEPPQKPVEKSLPELKGMINNLKPNGVNLSSATQVAADNGKTTKSSVWQGPGNNPKLDPKASPLNLEHEILLDRPQTSAPFSKHSGNPNFDNKPLLSHTLSENGRKLEQFQTASSTKPGVSDIRKVDKKSRSVINGLTEVQEPSTKLPLRAKGIVVEATPPAKKPPHPDLKYLSQILTVPSVEWSDFDDQQWLFGNKESENAKKTRTGPSQVGEETQVWAEALRMESSDITALPYVIPY